MTEEFFNKYEFYHGTEIQIDNIDKWIRVKYVDFVDKTINDIKIKHITNIRTILTHKNE